MALRTIPTASSETSLSASFMRTFLSLPLATWMLIAFVPMNAFAGHWGYMGVPGPVDRAVLAGIILFTFLERNHPVFQGFSFRGLHVAMVAMVAWTAWSAFNHGTLTTSNGFYALLDRLAVPFFLFSVSAYLLRPPLAREIMLRVLTVFGVYLGGTACLEMLGGRALVFPAFIVNESLGIQPDRARGPFLASEADGVVLVVCAAAAIVVAMTSKGLMRLTALCAAPLTLLGALLTLTRSVWLGMIVVVAVAALWYPQVRKPLGMACGAGVAAIVVGLAAVAPLREAIIDRLTTQRSLDDRANTNEAAFRILAERPFEGIGWGRFLDEGIDWVRIAESYPVTNVGIEVHNVPLSRAAELGIPAALLWCLIVLFGPVRAVLRQSTDSLYHWRYVATVALLAWVPPTMLSPNPYPLPNNIIWILTGALAVFLMAGTDSVKSYAADNADNDGTTPSLPDVSQPEVPQRNHG